MLYWEAAVALSGGILSRLRVIGAVVFGAATLLYAATWTYYTQHDAPESLLGITYQYDGWKQTLLVERVDPGSPAAGAGVESGDLIVAVNGQPLTNPNPFFDIVTRGRPGDHVRLSVARRGGAPAVLDVALAQRPAAERPGAAERLALYPLRLYPLPFVLVGLAVLALRVHDANAWLLALSFASLASGATDVIERTVSPSLRNVTLAYALLFSGMGPAFFYALLARFPVRSPLDRRLPWVRPALLVFASVIFIPLATTVLVSGSVWPAVRAMTVPVIRLLDVVVVAYSFGAIGLGLVSLFLNCRSQVEAGARRKARLAAWSFTIGFVPVVLLNAAAVILRKGVFDLPFWFWAPCALLMMLMPVLFGYAVVRHRVLEFSVLVRRSARYLLVHRGFVLLALLLSIAVTAIFVSAIARVLPRLTADAAIPAGIAAGTVFGLVLFRTGGAVATRVTRRIDRAFFRSAYDARLILEELAQRAPMAMSRNELASLLEEEVRDALHPTRIAIYLMDVSRTLRRFVGVPGDWPDTLEHAPELVERFQRNDRPIDASSGAQVPGVLAALDAECAVPILTRRRTLVGALLVGARLSDEPYSREDRRLLSSVASQAGTALDNLILAEEMAERLEAERRARQEVEIAAEVQRRLLPTRTVPMATIEYVGHCVQARAVGGDYYDFLDFGPKRMGLALGDVSGKGLYAALLTTHLQASVRGLAIRLATEDLGVRARRRQPVVLRVDGPQPLRDVLHRPLRGRHPAAVLRQLRPPPSHDRQGGRNPGAPGRDRERHRPPGRVDGRGRAGRPQPWRRARHLQRRRHRGDEPRRGRVRRNAVGRPARILPRPSGPRDRGPRDPRGQGVQRWRPARRPDAGRRARAVTAAARQHDSCDDVTAGCVEP